MSYYEVSATIVSKLFEAKPHKYKKIYKIFKDKKFIPQIYSTLNAVVKMINDGASEEEIENKIENGYYVATPNVNWKQKTIELIKVYKEFVSENHSLKNIKNYRGKKLYIDFKYKNSKDLEETTVRIHSTPTFFNEYRGKKYLYYLLPSENGWTEKNIKGLYALLNEALKCDPIFKDFKEIRILHLPKKNIVKGISTTNLIKEARDIIELFYFYVLERSEKENIENLNAIISEFTDDYDFNF